MQNVHWKVLPAALKGVLGPLRFKARFLRRERACRNGSKVFSDDWLPYELADEKDPPLDREVSTLPAEGVLRG